MGRNYMPARLLSARPQHPPSTTEAIGPTGTRRSYGRNIRNKSPVDVASESGLHLGMHSPSKTDVVALRLKDRDRDEFEVTVALFR